LQISNTLRIKAETYYQYLYDIPVKEKGFPEYSLINSGGDFGIKLEDSLQNKGTGKNEGIEVTIEKFFENDFYYLATVSLFDSKYKGNDHIERNTSFNQNFVINLLGGYEFVLKNNNFLSINLKNVYAGGKRFVPIDIESSLSAGKTIYNWRAAYQKRYENFFRTDIRVGYKINRRKLSFEMAADLQNITNTKQPFLQTFDPETGIIKSKLQFGFLPMLTLKLEF
jgi:hypothetical protein